jgi:hypothetical protein
MLQFTSKYIKFWKWFRAHEDEIFYFDADREKVFDRLAARMGRVHRNLTFEFSSVCDGRREFVVSAGGITQAFSEVIALVREAPELPRWQIIAFRQRKDMPVIHCGGKSLQRDEVFVDYTLNGDKIDLTVFVPGLANGSANDITGLKTIGYLLLDATIGEYDVETKIAGIEFVDSSSFPEKRRMRLLQLPAVIDSLPGTVQ